MRFLRTVPARSRMCHGQHFFFKMASNMAAIYKMAAQKAVFIAFRCGFLRTVPAWSRMCHGQHFFQNGFQHGCYLQNGSSKSSFTALSPKSVMDFDCSFLRTLPARS